MSFIQPRKSIWTLRPDSNAPRKAKSSNKTKLLLKPRPINQYVTSEPAPQQVFLNPDLLEMILLQLPLDTKHNQRMTIRQTIRMMRVCHSFRNTILESRKVMRMIYVYPSLQKSYHCICETELKRPIISPSLEFPAHEPTPLVEDLELNCNTAINPLLEYLPTGRFNPSFRCQRSKWPHDPKAAARGRLLRRRHSHLFDRLSQVYSQEEAEGRLREYLAYGIPVLEVDDNDQTNDPANLVVPTLTFAKVDPSVVEIMPRGQSWEKMFLTKPPLRTIQVWDMDQKECLLSLDLEKGVTVGDLRDCVSASKLDKDSTKLVNVHLMNWAR